MRGTALGPNSKLQRQRRCWLNVFSCQLLKASVTVSAYLLPRCRLTLLLALNPRRQRGHWMGRSEDLSEYKVTLKWERGGAEFSYQKYPRDHTWSFDGGYTAIATVLMGSEGDASGLNKAR